MSFHVYGQILQYVNDACNSYISQQVSVVAAAIEPAAVSLLGTYIILWGIAHARGLIQEPIIDAAIRITKISFIFGIGIYLGHYNDYVVDTFFDSPEKFANILTHSSSADGSIVNSLDSVMNNAFDIGNYFWQQAGLISNIGAYLIAILAWLAGIVITAYACFLIILSKIALSILIALGPLFIISLLFDSSKRFFEAWISQLVNYSLIIILVIASNVFVIHLFEEAARSAAALQGNVEIAQLVPFFAMSIVCLLVLAQVPAIASALAGGISLSSYGFGRLSVAKAVGLSRQGIKTGAALGKASRNKIDRYYQRIRSNSIRPN